MGSIELKGRYQKAVLWEADPVADANGEQRVRQPVSLDVRWEERVSQLVNSTESSKRIIADVMVDRKIPEGSILWKGDIKDLNKEGIPPAPLLRVEHCEVTPDDKCRYEQISVLLVKTKDRLPTVV